MGERLEQTPKEAARDWARKHLVVDRNSQDVNRVTNETMLGLQPGAERYYEVGYAEELARKEEELRAIDPASRKLGAEATERTNETLAADMTEYVQEKSQTPQYRHEHPISSKVEAETAAEDLLVSLEKSQARQAEKRALEEDPARIDDEIAKKRAELEALEAKRELLAA